MIGPGTSAATLTSSTPRDQRLWRLASAAVLAFLAALLIVTCIAAYAPVDQGFRTTASNVTTVLSAFAAAAVCLWASQTVRSGRERVGWLILALGFASNLAAETLWTYFVMVAGIEVPFPSVADVFYLGFYPLAFVGILLLVQTRASRTVRALTVTDSLLFTLGVSGLLWQLLIVPSLSGEDDLVTTVVALSYPVGDFLVIFALCSLFLATELRTVRMAATLLLASFICTVAADLGFAYLALNDAFADASSIDPLWTVGYALAAVAALQRLREARGDVARQADDERAQAVSSLSSKRTGSSLQAVARLMVPYVAVPAALIMIMVALLGGDDIVLSPGSLAVVGFSLGLLGLVMVRQFLTLFENVRLSRSYEALSRDLEQRVRERTRELTTLNHTAAVLSRCLRTRDVLESGLSLALDAAGARAGAVWLRRADGLEFAAHELDAAVVDQLEELARDRLATAERATSTRPAVLESGDEPELADALRDAHAGAARVLFVPLLSRGEVVGTLALVLPDHAHRNASQEQLEESLGAQIGVAVENARQYEEARYMAERDSVTDILNHRALQQRLEQECRRAARAGGAFALVMMDLDGFKLFNDTYGHPGGDAALRQVAELLTSMVRESDVVGRYGGDEFLALLPDTGAHAAVALCQRLRKGLAERPFTTADGALIPLQLSFGVASYPDDGRTSNELIALADASLYRSKQRGGDQITATGEHADDDSAVAGGMFGVLDSLVTAVDNKDKYTRHHSDDVTERALMLAQQISLSHETQRALRIAGLLHDVGKIGVPDRILRKPGRLTEEELEVVRQHAMLSEIIIKEIPNLHEVVAAAGSHHERWDGTGYPRGLKGTEIPLLGRILAVADAWSAMTTDRPYRKALTEDEARRELVRMKGRQFDPELVDAFLVCVDAGDAALERAG